MKHVVLFSLLVATPALADKLPLVVVLHGYGASPDDIVHLVDGLGVKARVIAPHGATAVGDGWAWFPLRAQVATEAQLDDGLRAASDALAKTIAGDLREHPACGRPIVTGFSQGGMLSYGLAARSPAVVALAAPIGGFLPKALFPTTKPKDAPTIAAFHGEADERVALRVDQAANDYFRSLGYATSLKTYPGLHHAVSPEEASDVKKAIEDAIRAQGCAK